ncbi:MAG: rhodanese-like domain-containing protein [Muricauda sp.]|jgi:rhodanese-related sulfurtransferase|uniref:Thioredoxin family protein n=1 Tax=Flagellimonas lutaonensis TaxID=516051 RepID=A0A0D5YTN8_9FLAO|nr:MULTISPECIES: rhodanese-like domain-containing protein [Allomuricauda]AKA35228.1 thioredoxin family protein [Allomuricauda lutaonensis]MAU26401.1 rhodanese-like domain-containing protein [Allomuricauda sp.]MBC29517.1 rhodanese-like domain-containing protein [Allomuricauda sp.]|tara:strand:- start:533 stop:904 length:372 start_codon:yes stop_codon:yes gene_type:complete
MRPAFVCALLLFLGLSCKSQGEPSISVIDKATMQAQVIGKDVQLIDVRTPQEYEAGHIDDALNFDIKNQPLFKEKIGTLDKDKPVYLYCKMGGRSARAAALLKEMGFKEIYDYSGGYDEWSSQ